MSQRSDAYAHRVVIAVGTAAAAVLLVLAIWAAMHMLLLIFGGILLAVLLRALGETLARYTRLSENVSVWIVIAAFAAALGTGGYFMWAELTGQFDELARSLSAMWEKLRGRMEEHAWGREILNMLGAQQGTPERASTIGRVFAAVLGGVSGLVISIFIGLYVAANPALYRHGFLRLVPLQYRDHVDDIIGELHETLRSWLVGTLVLMVLVGVLTTAGLFLLGIPYAAALGLIAFLLEFIPYIGPIVAALPAVLVASTLGAEDVLFVLLLYWGVQSLEGYVLSPLVYQQSVKIPPMLTIGAQVVLATLLGVLGVIFATPLTACAMVLVQRFYVEDALGDRIERPIAQR